MFDIIAIAQFLVCLIVFAFVLTLFYFAVWHLILKKIPFFRALFSIQREKVSEPIKKRS